MSTVPDPQEVGRRVWAVLGRAPLRIGLALIVVFGILGSYQQIEPAEAGVVLRFGRMHRVLPPGPNFVMPFGIERVYRLPVQRQLKEEFGYRTLQAGQKSQFTTSPETLREALMLTGDLNVATVEWIVQYKIADPYKYLFHVRGVGDTFRDMAEAAMRQVVGDHSVTEVLTVGREAIQDAAKQELQELCNRYDNGIQVLQLVLQDVNPPEAVRASFNEVNQAEQERERSVNEAWSEYNKAIPTARGAALERIKQAEGDAIQRVNNAKGDVAGFLSLVTEAQKAPKITRTRLYLENLAQVLPRAGRRILVDPEIKGMLPLYGLTGAATVAGGAK